MLLPLSSGGCVYVCCVYVRVHARHVPLVHALTMSMRSPCPCAHHVHALTMSMRSPCLCAHHVHALSTLLLSHAGSIGGGDGRGEVLLLPRFVTVDTLGTLGWESVFLR
jgi:hypothetical protein